MSEHDIAKALEVWGLQTLLDLSIFTGLAALILASLQNYYQQIEKLLFLRVLIEFWRLITVVLIEVLLFFTVIIGFTFVMEAPADEFLQLHPSAFWAFVKGYLRSNAAPHGLEVAYVTFWICFPLLLLVFVWGLLSARKTNSQK